MTTNFTPSLLMALTDYIPVLLYLAALIILGFYIRRNGRTFSFIMFIVGALVSSFGGFAKATWKLLLAILGKNIYWLDDFQFLFLGFGISLIFISILTIVFNRKIVNKKMAVPALLLIKDSNAFYYLLILIVLSTLGYLCCLIIIAKKIKSHISVVLYIVYGVLSTTMGALSGSGEYEIVNWIAQSINTLGMTALLIANYNLNKKDLELKEINSK